MPKPNKNAETNEGQGPNTDATAAAPIAASDASSSSPSTEGSVKGDISVSGGKIKPAKEKKPSFEPNVAARTELLAMTNDDLRAAAGDTIPAIGANDHRVFQIDETHGLTDRLVGSPLERSGIRSGVIEFLRSRTDDLGVKTEHSTFEQAAPGWAIASYMKLAADRGVVKGKFDQGYLAARGNDVRRGMVARGQLRIVADLTPPKTEDAGDGAAPAAE